MNTAVATAQGESPSVMSSMAERFGMDRRAFEATLMNTVMPHGNNTHVTREHVAAFLLVAKKYDLNPFTKEIYAFPAKGGGVQPIVSIDGWMKIINDHPQFDGMKFQDKLDDNGKLLAVTCIIYRKDRRHPVEVTEYMSECQRGTDPWQKWPARMLRHKAAIQAARYAFGFSGIMEPDEAERMMAATTTVAHAERAEPEPWTDEAFQRALPKWRDVIESGKRTAAEVEALARTKGTLNDDQIAAIHACAEPENDAGADNNETGSDE